MEAARILAAVLLISAAACPGGPAWTKQDSWYRARPVGSPRGVDVDPELVHPVVAEMATEAEQLLLDSSATEIDIPTASLLIGGPLSPAAGMRPFLVRGVYLNDRYFVLSQSKNILVVHSGSLGRHAVPMKRQPLVVLLESPPSEVYVECSMAE